ncbi:MAG TPA: phytoene desaturase family protein [Ilumatobacter sp.]
MRVVVIGAGLGGLSAAAHLRASGHEVTVLERSARPGGRAGTIVGDGFRLDTGPVVFTMPDALADTFRAVQRTMSDYVTLDRVDPMYRAVFADGSVLHVRHGREAMTDEVRRFANAREAGAFNEFCEWLTELYHIEVPRFVEMNYDSVFDLVKPWRALLDLVRHGGFGPLDRKVASFFEDERLRRMFSFQAMYAGVTPREALAIYSVITYLDTVDGVFAPRGGVQAVADGLAKAVTEAGVTIRYETNVVRILRTGEGSVAGVDLGGDRLPADAVVCNADLPVAYRTLLGGVEAPRVARHGRYSPSCLLWVAGVRGAPLEGAAHHNVHFGRRFDEPLRALTKRGVRMSDPTTLVTVASVTDPSRAPAGCSTLYALEPMPNLDGKVDWAKHGARYTAELRARIGALGYPVDDVVVERAFDPLDWEAMGLERGTPFSLAHTFRQSGPLRPRNVDRRVPGLAFTGSSTVPGVGVPMVLISGKLAARRIDHYARTSSVHRW